MRMRACSRRGGKLLSPVLFFPFPDLVQAFSPFCFRSLIGWNVVFLPLEGIRQALHGGDVAFVIMGVLIALPETEILHEGGGGVPDIHGDRLVQHPERISLCIIICGLHGVVFGRQGTVDYGVGQVDGALGHADEVAGLVGIDGDAESPGIRHADVLGGKRTTRRAM